MLHESLSQSRWNLSFTGWVSLIEFLWLSCHDDVSLSCLFAVSGKRWLRTVYYEAKVFMLHDCIYYCSSHKFYDVSWAIEGQPSWEHISLWNVFFSLVYLASSSWSRDVSSQNFPGTSFIVFSSCREVWRFPLNLLWPLLVLKRTVLTLLFDIPWSLCDNEVRRQSIHSLLFNSFFEDLYLLFFSWSSNNNSCILSKEYWVLWGSSSVHLQKEWKSRRYWSEGKIKSEQKISHHFFVLTILLLRWSVVWVLCFVCQNDRCLAVTRMAKIPFCPLLV